MNFVPKLKIEVVVADNQADSAIKIITHAAKTGHIGDGKTGFGSVESTISARSVIDHSGRALAGA